MAMVNDNPRLFALRSHHDVISLIRQLNSGTPLERDSLVRIARTVLGQQRASTEVVLRSVDLAVSLWLDISVSSLEFPRPGLLVWQDGESLGDLVTSSLTHKASPPEKDKELADNTCLYFTAESLVTKHDYMISWTSNLAEHMSIDWKHKIITVYEHKICLYNHLRFQNPILPPETLREALDTLNLLFPFQDDATKRFLNKHKKPFYGLGWCGRPTDLTLGDFQIWRAKVEDLAYIARGPAVGLQQLRLDKDRRNVLSFATFWVAIGVGILTIVSICFAVAATVYGTLQYDVALKQYRLSVAQACLDPSVKKALPEFCL